MKITLKDGDFVFTEVNGDEIESSALKTAAVELTRRATPVDEAFWKWAMEIGPPLPPAERPLMPGSRVYEEEDGTARLELDPRLPAGTMVVSGKGLSCLLTGVRVPSIATLEADKAAEALATAKLSSDYDEAWERKDTDES